MKSEPATAEVKDAEAFKKNNLVISENPVLRYLTFSE